MQVEILFNLKKKLFKVTQIVLLFLSFKTTTNSIKDLRFQIQFEIENYARSIQFNNSILC